MPVDLLLLAVGLVLLARAADAFVLGAARLAEAMDVSSLVIGTVLVGFGTSVPEMLVSGLAAADDETPIAVGNVIGSNLANITLVLGVSGLIAKVEVLPKVLRREAPISLAAVLVFAILVQGGIGRVDGVVLVLLLAVGIVLVLRSDAKAAADPEPELTEELIHEVEEELHPDGSMPSTRRSLVMALLGLGGTLVGAHLLVQSAIGIADELGLSGGFVGLTIVAVGTSLPELVAGVQSARRGEGSLLIGNVLGSNMFNSLGVGGIAALVGPASLTDSSLTVIGGGAMVLGCTLGTVFLRGGELRRWEAGLLLAVYVVTVPLLA